MKKFIFSLVAAIALATIAVYVFPRYYKLYTSGQIYNDARTLLMAGKVDEGLEKVRVSLYILKDDPSLFRAAQVKVPDLLTSAALENPLDSERLTHFISEQGVNVDCETRSVILSTVLESARPLFYKREFGEVNRALHAASSWRGECSINSETEHKFARYKKAYEKLSGSPFAEVPSLTLSAKIPDTASHPTPEVTETKSYIEKAASLPSSMLDTVKASLSGVQGIKDKTGSVLSGFSSLKDRFLRKAEVKEKPLKKPEEIPSQKATEKKKVKKVAEKKPVKKAAEQTEVKKAVDKKEVKKVTEKKKTERKPLETAEEKLARSLKADLKAAGIRLEAMDLSKPETIRIAFNSSNLNKPALIVELKTIFELIERNITLTGLRGKIKYMEISV
ncbi:MAG: hypothetical protein AB1546_03960, partial [bacterium]